MLMKSALKTVLTPVLILLFLIGFMLITNPNRLPLLLLMVPFLVFFFFLFYILKSFGKNQSKLRRRQRLIRAGVVASIPVLLLVLQTIHQLTIKDVLITLGLVLLATYYLNKADFL